MRPSGVMRQIAVCTRWARPRSILSASPASCSSSALPSTRRPTATTVSAASTKAFSYSFSPRISFLAASALARASRFTICRGTSPLVTLSSIVVGRSASGVMPACSSSASRRGEAEASTSFGRSVLGVVRARTAREIAGGAARAGRGAPCGTVCACRGCATGDRHGQSLLLKPVSDPTFSEIIGRHLDQNLVARKHPDPVLAHSSRRMGDDLVIVLEFHPEGGVGEEFRHHSRKFEHFFLRHKSPSQSKSGGEWSGETAKSRTIPKRSKDRRFKRPAQSAHTTGAPTTRAAAIFAASRYRVYRVLHIGRAILSGQWLGQGPTRPLQERRASFHPAHNQTRSSPR